MRCEAATTRRAFASSPNSLVCREARSLHRFTETGSFRAAFGKSHFVMRFSAFLIRNFMSVPNVISPDLSKM